MIFHLLKRRCKHRYSFATHEGRCWRRGRTILFGYCWTHFLDKCQWEHQGKHLRFRLDLSRFSLPFVMIDEERPVSYVSVGIGTDGCDPGFEIGWNRK